VVRTIADLEMKLKDVHPLELDRFVQWYLSDVCRLIKPGNQLLLTEEGYYCSACKEEVPEDKSGWVYCTNCTVSLNCCDELDAPCDVCGPKAEDLIRDTYRKLH